jgi:hypothetical protein
MKVRKLNEERMNKIINHFSQIEDIVLTFSFSFTSLINYLYDKSH